MAWVVLATPLLSQPIVNPDVFDEPPAQLVREVLGNYIPAFAIVVSLLALQRWVAPVIAARTREGVVRVLVHTLAAGLVAAVASVLVLPLHRLATEPTLALAVYLQRNVGFTCMVVFPALLLDRHRARARAAERRALEQQELALRAQLEALQSRTQPHFLFNVLNTIASLIRDDVELAEHTVHRLADVLRHALASTRSDRVSVARELEVVGEYLEIQRARYGARLRHKVTVARDAAELLLPPFVVQPLVENAVLHAVAGRASGGTIVVDARRDGERLRLRVCDDGPGPGGSQHRGNGTSLDDLRRRLALLHGDTASLSTGAGEGGGFEVELVLPALESRPCG